MNRDYLEDRDFLGLADAGDRPESVLPTTLPHIRAKVLAV
jgi:hypothetical protein